MRRKIIKLAEKTLVVSLPAAWASAQHLSKGDEVDVLEEDDRLVIIPPSDEERHSSVEVDIKGMSERVLRWNISSYHKQGYDEIIVLNYTLEQYRIIEELTQALFIGFLVKEKSELRIIIGQVAAVSVSEFDSTLRRGFRQLKAMAAEQLQAFEKQDAELMAQQLTHEQNNNKITNFCERLLNRNLLHKENGHFWYVIAWNLEKTADTLKYIAKAYPNATLGEEATALYKDVVGYLDDYCDLLYDFSFDTLIDLSERKKALTNRAVDLLTESDPKDRVCIQYLHQLILQLADFSASIIAVR